MKHKAVIAALFLMAVAALILGCKDLWHPEEYNPATIVEDGNVHTVSFSANRGSGSPPNPQSAQSGESIWLPYGESLYRANYFFVGWTVNPDEANPIYPAGASLTCLPHKYVSTVWDHYMPRGGLRYSRDSPWMLPRAARCTEQEAGITRPQAVRRQYKQEQLILCLPH